MSMTKVVSQVKMIAISELGEIYDEKEHKLQDYFNFSRFCKKNKAISQQLYQDLSSIANIKLDKETTTKIYKEISKVKNEIANNEAFIDFYYICSVGDVLMIEMF